MDLVGREEMGRDEEEEEEGLEVEGPGVLEGELVEKGAGFDNDRDRGMRLRGGGRTKGEEERGGRRQEGERELLFSRDRFRVDRRFSSDERRERWKGRTHQHYPSRCSLTSSAWEQHRRLSKRPSSSCSPRRRPSRS